MSSEFIQHDKGKEKRDGLKKAEISEDWIRRSDDNSGIFFYFSIKSYVMRIH